ncbi:MAG: LysR substrate-binding domain-containing protein [Flavobacteriaceae bacterium]|nr:LysR substrate-binding domain-containing protein [Flavobacteriaceae bacterium]
MTLIQLEYVLAVAESRNFTLAAEKAFVTQPTLSMQIQKLEKELNIEIFDRSTHPIKITAIGQKVLDQAQIILRESRKMSHIVNDLRENVEGDYVMGVIPTVLSTLVPLFYKNFKTKFPKVNLRVKEMKTEAMLEALANNEIDFGIAVTPTYNDDFIEIPLYHEPMVAYVPEYHRLSNQEKIKDSDLQMKDLLLIEEGHCFRNNVLSICKTINQNDYPQEALNVDSGSLFTLVKLSQDGLGMTVLPALQAEDIPKDYKQFIKQFEEPVPTREVSIIYHSTQLKLRFVDELHDLIQSLVRGKNFIESENRTMPNLKLIK